MAGIYTTQDIFLTDDGDFQVTADGDLRVADPDEDVRQEAIICLYTPVGEFDAFPALGSQLVSFIGEPNNRENAALMRQEVVRALSQYAGFSKSDLSVTITPVAIDEVLIRLAIQNAIGTGTQTLCIDFNYVKGPTIVNG